MKKTKKVVITHHTDKLKEWYHLLPKHGYCKDDILIYHRDNPTFVEKIDFEKLNEYGTVIKTPNVGYNIWVIGKYILDHYDNLPDISIFLKCNSLSKGQTTQENLERGLDADYFFPMEADPISNNLISYRSFTINDRIFQEKMDYLERSNTKVYPRIKNFADFLNDLFVIPKMPDYILFTPGNCYVVPKENILKRSKNFYKKMMIYTDYHHQEVQEAHWWERSLDLAWESNFKENMSFIV